MSSGLNSSAKRHQELIQTPSGSVSKRDILLSQSKSGVKSERRQEPSTRAQEPVQPFIDIPPRDQRQAFNFITLGRFQINSTITRIRICKFILLLNIKMLAILTATVFWLATAIYLKTLLNWEGPRHFFYELALRYFSDAPQTTSIWRHIFPGTNYGNSHHLRLTVHRSSNLQSTVIYSTLIPLLIDNPMVWLFVMVCMFINHYLLCVATDFLSKVHPTIRPAN